MKSESEPSPPFGLEVPANRERLGRAHQMRVDISIAIAMTPVWLRRALADRNAAKARGARFEIVERIAFAIERRFAVTWLGSVDPDENARPVEEGGPLFGGPDSRDPYATQSSNVNRLTQSGDGENIK